MLSFDEDDTFFRKNLDWVRNSVKKSNTSFFYCIAKNSGIIQATNRLYNRKILENTDIAVIHSDDMRFPPSWVTHILGKLQNVGFDKLLKVRHPGEPDENTRELLTLQIGGSQAFLDYGAFFCPEYTSVYGDNDLTEWAKKNRRFCWALELPPFPHLHPGFKLPEDVVRLYGTVPYDQTYSRENSQAAYTIGEKVFAARSALGFPPVSFTGASDEIRRL